MWPIIKFFGRNSNPSAGLLPQKMTRSCRTSIVWLNLGVPSGGPICLSSSYSGSKALGHGTANGFAEMPLLRRSPSMCPKGYRSVPFSATKTSSKTLGMGFCQNIKRFQLIWLIFYSQDISNYMHLIHNPKQPFFRKNQLPHFYSRDVTNSSWKSNFELSFQTKNFACK